MTLSESLTAGVPGIIAILRGLQPERSLEVGAELVACGVRIIEVPMNSPQPLLSIERLAAKFGEQALIGAGTVLSPAQVRDVETAGGRLIVSPNMDRAVVEQTLQLGLESLPGVMTATEALAAVAAGAKHLKLFPASSAGPGHLRALRDVLPSDVRLWAVGGAGASNLQDWLAVGAAGIGVGGALFTPDTSTATVTERARALISAWTQATSGRISQPNKKN
jgi:2-dehydro-3-deoxyphosphogalactonate aldolase